MFNIDTSLWKIIYILYDYAYFYTLENNVWRVYGDHLVRLFIRTSVCTPVCPFARSSVRFSVQCYRYTSFLLKDIVNFYFTQRLLITWIWPKVILANSRSLEGRKSAKLVLMINEFDIGSVVQVQPTDLGKIMIINGK